MYLNARQGVVSELSVGVCDVGASNSIRVMNVSDRLPGLQRRTGRRRSTPASPSSPTSHRRHGRSQDIPVFSPIEPHSANTTGESPSIDLNVPSPTFDLASISPALPSEANAGFRMHSLNRTSDDLGKHRPKFLAETGRPATSSAGAGITQLSQNKPPFSPESAGSTESPLTAAQRAFNEAPKRPRSREQDDGSAQRAAAFWAHYDKNSQEDSAGPKHLTNSRKSRFNLLNPMTLLARRRSSQNTNKLDDLNLNVQTLHVPAIPDNIEPSIRGTKIHDFSVPRVRRTNNEGTPKSGFLPSPNYPRRPSEIFSPPVDSSMATPASLHSPMFREHFQEDQRTVQPANTAYLHAQSLQAPAGASLPSFAKNLPLQPPSGERKDQWTEEAGDLAECEVQLPEPEMPPPPPPKSPSPAQEIHINHTLPKHMASTSSRFSFIGQQGSLAQEKFLEDKHKEHASKQPAKVRFSAASIDNMDDFDDYDGYEEDDGFDTGDIIIKNIDLPSSHAPPVQPRVTSSMGHSFESESEDEFGTGDIVIRNINDPTSEKCRQTNESQTEGDNIITQEIELPPTGHLNVDAKGRLQSHRQSLQAFHFTPQSLTFSPSTTHFTSQSTPRDVNGLPIGMAQFKEAGVYDQHSQIRESVDQSPESMFYEGLGINTAPPERPLAGHVNVDKQPFDDSDLYFDDGEFGDVVETGDHFNEDLLDDPEQIKDIPAENERKYQEKLNRSVSEAETKLPTEKSGSAHHALPEPSHLRAESPQISFQHQQASQDGLTEGNLAAHHHALALALKKVAANGTFDRTVSFSQASDDETDSPFHNSRPDISSRGSRYSNNLISSAISDDDGFGFDDDIDDEAMIAAANAEALENDDDGFYGQEFGFYARAHARDSAEFINGGYFTSRGSNGVKRSHSGKNNFQEPSLTPITERSEYSTRNSVASMPQHAVLPGAGQAAKLRDLDSPIADDEMSFNSLMMLRVKAFGGSSSSINSLGDRHYSLGSPLAHLSGYNPLLTEAAGGRMSSPISAGLKSLSIAESEDEDEEVGRQTLTQNTPHKKHSEPTRDTSHSSREQEPLTSSPMSRKGNHSRNSSGAGSVSYARDTDGRWVLERRRTGDDGELELVEREYLAGAQI